MMLKRCGLMGLLSLSLASPAIAQPTPTIPPLVAAPAPASVPARHAPKSQGWNGVGMALFSAAATLAGVLGGIAVDQAQCSNSPEDQFSIFCGPGWGAVLGSVIGLTLGPLVYDDLIGDGEGSLSSAYGGLVIGFGAMLILVLATEGEAGVVGIFFPFVGAGVGYSVYAPHDARTRSVRPALNVQRTPEGGRRVTAGVGFSF